MNYIQLYHEANLIEEAKKKKKKNFKGDISKPMHPLVE